MGPGYRFISFALCAAAIVGFAPAVQAAPQATASAGAGIAQQGVASHSTPACQSCHGLKGEGQVEANIPRLAGLGAGYIERQLGLFASGARRNAIMGPIAQGLMPVESASVAAYYTALPPPKTTPPPSPPVDVTRGERLAKTGRWSANIPPCAACHGADGLGVGSTSPPLSAQPAGYLESAINAWRQGDRTGDPLGLMTGVAQRLAADEVHEVAAYYAAQPARAAPSNHKTARGPK